MAKEVKNTKKNHYNPRGHLKGFADNDGNIYRYRKDNAKMERREYAGWGYKMNLYPQSVEDMLEKFDNDLPKIVSNVEAFHLKGDKAKTLPIEQIHSLARFIVFQITRTPKFKKQLDKNSEIVKKQSKIYQNVPELRAMCDQMYSGDAWFEEVLIDVNNKMVEEVLKHTWIFLIAEEDAEFILGDTGLATGTINLKDNAKGLGLGSPDTLKWFPLSKKICLQITSDQEGFYISKNGKNGILSAAYPKTTVAHINGLIALCTDEYIYASSSGLINAALEEANTILKNTEKELENLSVKE